MSVLSQITCDLCDRSVSAADWDGIYISESDLEICADCVWDMEV